MMRCFRRKRLHLILAVREKNAIDLLVQGRRQLFHLDTVEHVVGTFCDNNTLCKDATDKYRWLVGGTDRNTGKGFIKSIRIVYK